MTRALDKPKAVTFDCWSTLLYEPNPGRARAARIALVSEAVGVDPERAAHALETAWRHHSAQWHRRVAFTAHDMTAMALDSLGVTLDAEDRQVLVSALEDVALAQEVSVVDGARDAVQALARAGVRRALVCDTGFTPGRVVRRLLDRVGLLALLETCVFSDEVGVPKPEPATFASALGVLGVAPAFAVHVGDMRRSDVAGARAFGMGSVRLSAFHDDASLSFQAAAGVIDCVAAGCDPVCARPEADAVVARYSDLLGVLGFDSD